LLLDLIQPTGTIINNGVQNTSETIYGILMRVLIGYLTPEEYFISLRSLGQNKADVDALC
jgi:hypothetical protein